MGLGREAGGSSAHGRSNHPRTSAPDTHLPYSLSGGWHTGLDGDLGKTAVAFESFNLVSFFDLSLFQ